MQTTRQPRSLWSATMVAIGAIALVGTTFVGTAGATVDGHGSRQTAYTEDNDHNDGGTLNNVADSGDDKHPSGKDRSVEHGGSGNQGKAQSDPDDDGRGPDRSNGGPDKPNGSGGVDKADQDGNNGCGNDDDFEDDNEGWCGNKPKAAMTPTTVKSQPPKDDDMPTTGNSGNGTAVITVDADCFSVSVSSSKDISNVVVTFTDGSSVKFDGMNGHQWSKTFTKAVASATAKSATTRTSDAAGSCATGALAEACPTGMVDSNGAAAGGCLPPEVLGGAATADCPIPSAGVVMPFGCDVTMGALGSVELLDGEVLSAGAFAAGTPVALESVSVRSAAPAGVLGSVTGALAFTGVNALTLLVAALLAIAAGWALLRADRRRSQS